MCSRAEEELHTNAAEGTCSKVKKVIKPASLCKLAERIGLRAGSSQGSLDEWHSLNSQFVYLEGLHNLQREDFSVCHHLFIPFEKHGLAGMCLLIALQFGS